MAIRRRLPTASKHPRVMNCPGSFLLPQKKEEAGEFTVRGSVIHEYLKNVLAEGRELALEAVPEDHKEICEAIDTEQLPASNPDAYAGEVTLEWDTSSGSFTSKYYEDRPPTPGVGVYQGTADILAVTGDGRTIYVGDYKTGRGNVPTASQNWQLKTLAFMAARRYECEEAVVEILYVWGSDVFRSRATFDAMDLDLIEVELLEMRDRLDELADEAQPPTKVGEWCQYCPAYVYCPSQTRLIHAVTSAPEKIEEALLSMLTPENASTAYRRWKAAHNALKQVGEALRKYAMSVDGIQVDDNGTVYGPRKQTREFVNGNVAYDVLKDKYGEDVAKAACEMKASKASIERALRPHSNPRHNPLGKMKDEVLESLRVRDGVERKTTETVSEHKRDA